MTAGQSDLDPTNFRQRFPSIRVHFDWERFNRESWPVEIETIGHRDQFSNVFTSFRYSLGRVNPRFLHWLFLRNLRVGEAANRQSIFPNFSRQRIDEYRQAFSLVDAVNLELPAFRLAGGNVYLMDGNHRAIAAHLSGRPVRLRTYVVDGPKTPEVCSDLPNCR